MWRRLLLRAWSRGPRRGEIWWADVPYPDGSGSKLRPCLVLRRTLRGTVVLKITSRDKSRRRDHVPVPTRAWDPRAGHDSYLNLAEPIVMRRGRFQRRAGVCDPVTLVRAHNFQRRREVSLRPASGRRRRTP